MATADPAFQVACPKCRASAGSKCVNYLKKGKFTCKERVDLWASDPLNVGPGIATHPEPTAPMVCKPLGTLALMDVPGFPEGVGGYLLTAKCNTLADLEKRAAKHTSYSGMDSRVYAAFRSIPGFTQDMAKAAMASVMAMLTLSNPPPSASPTKQPCGCPAVVDGLKGAHQDGCPYVSHSISRDGGDSLATWSKRNHPDLPDTQPSPTDFTEDTPPPRTRPKGSALPAFVTVPPGAIESEFAAWDKEGRIPEGSVLARFVGTLDTPSGYKCGSRAVPMEDERRPVVTIVEKGTGVRYAVLSPVEVSR